jgi:hypothetical protein
MKELKLSIKIEDNEMFEDTVREALRGEARKIAREEFGNIIEKEIKRIAESTVKNSTNWYSDIHGKVKESVTSEMRSELTKAFNEEDIPTFIKDNVEKRLDEIFAQMSLPTRIASLSEEQLKKLLSDIVMESLSKDR